MVGFGKLTPPSPSSALPPVSAAEAVPQDISGRTSYLRVRLAFHLYPQLIRWFCNTNQFGPPRGLTRASPWPWIAHPVSGLLLTTQRLTPLRADTSAPSSDSLSLRLRTAPVLNLAIKSNSPAHSSIGTPSLRLTPRALTACQRTVSGSLSLPARGAFHLSLTVLVHYWSRQVFSLGKWSPPLPTGFLVSGGTQDRRHPGPRCRRRDSHPLWSAFPEPFVSRDSVLAGVESQPPLPAPSSNPPTT